MLKWLDALSKVDAIYAPVIVVLAWAVWQLAKNYSKLQEKVVKFLSSIDDVMTEQAGDKLETVRFQEHIRHEVAEIRKKQDEIATAQQSIRRDIANLKVRLKSSSDDV